MEGRWKAGRKGKKEKKERKKGEIKWGKGEQEESNVPVDPLLHSDPLCSVPLSFVQSLALPGHSSPPPFSQPLLQSTPACPSRYAYPLRGYSFLRFPLLVSLLYLMIVHVRKAGSIRLVKYRKGEGGERQEMKKQNEWNVGWSEKAKYTPWK